MAYGWLHDIIQIIGGRGQFENEIVYQAHMKYMHIDIGKELAGVGMFTVKLSKTPQIRSSHRAYVSLWRPEDGNIEWEVRQSSKR